jgi:hypothetical protein
VDLRAQITSTVREVHIREGQNVQKGDLFSLVRAPRRPTSRRPRRRWKDKADLATAKVTSSASASLWQKFISSAALDVAQNRSTPARPDGGRHGGRDSTRVAQAYTGIRAPSRDARA